MFPVSKVDYQIKEGVDWMAIVQYKRVTRTYLVGVQGLEDGQGRFLENNMPIHLVVCIERIILNVLI